MSSDKKRKKSENKEIDNENIYVYEADKIPEEKATYEQIAEDPEKYLSEEEKAKIIAKIAFKEKVEKEFSEKRMLEEMEFRRKHEEELLQETIEKRRQIEAEDYAVEKISNYGKSIDNLEGLLEKRMLSGEEKLKNIKKWLIPILEKEVEIYHDYFYEIKLTELKKLPRESYKKTLNNNYLNVFGVVIETKDNIIKLIKGDLTQIIENDLNKEVKDKSLYRTLDTVFDNYFNICEEIEKEYRVIDTEGNSEINHIELSKTLQDSKKIWGTYIISLLEPHTKKESEQVPEEIKQEDTNSYIR